MMPKWLVDQFLALRACEYFRVLEFVPEKLCQLKEACGVAMGGIQ